MEREAEQLKLEAGAGHLELVAGKPKLEAGYTGLREHDIEA